MSNSSRTPGEVVFEKYLDCRDIPFVFEKEHTGKSTRPDYTIEWEGQTVVLDVKDFGPKNLTPGFGQFDPYPPIREKISKGRKKFKEFKEYCCGLVLYNAGQHLLFLDSPDIMLGAMYGDAGFTFPINLDTGIGDASQLREAFLERGKMIRLKGTHVENTTISAIITVMSIQPFLMELTDMIVENPGIDVEAEMRQKISDFNPYVEIPRVIVWHNAVARIPFPANLFRGDYDSHYGVVRRENGTVEQEVTYEGSAVPDRLKLSKPRQAPS